MATSLVCALKLTDSKQVLSGEVIGEVAINNLQNGGSFQIANKAFPFTVALWYTGKHLEAEFFQGGVSLRQVVVSDYIDFSDSVRIDQSQWDGGQDQLTLLCVRTDVP